jgi:hypothetical protein
MLSAARDDLANALAGYTPAVDGEHLTAAEEERTELLKRFPRSRWPKMAVTDYAIGQDDSSDTYCRWMEFRSTHLGSIKGGSSHTRVPHNSARLEILAG